MSNIWFHLYAIIILGDNMKILKNTIISILLILTILLFTNKKSNELPKTLDDLITYSILDDYELIEEIYYHDSEEDRNENIIVEKSYEKANDSGRFTLSIFSYQNKEVVVHSDNIINYEDKINSLVKTQKTMIDNHEFTIGFSGLDDFADVIGRAYVKKDDYIFLFSMKNFDSHLTDEQYNDFITMIKTIKFK